MGLASKSHQSASPFALKQMDKERKGREREIEYIQMEDVRMRQIAQVVILWTGLSSAGPQQQSLELHRKMIRKRCLRTQSRPQKQDVYNVLRIHTMI